MACSGGFRYSPTTSWSFSTNLGSLESLKVSIRCGLRPCSFQIRPMVESLKPVALAMVERLQWVWPSGFSRRVFWTTAARRAESIFRLRPARGASFSMPGSPNFA